MWVEGDEEKVRRSLMNPEKGKGVKRTKRENTVKRRERKVINKCYTSNVMRQDDWRHRAKENRLFGYRSR